LNIPCLLYAFADELDLLVFIYEKLNINLYKYSFTESKEFTTKKYNIDKLIPGSVDNFGGYNVNIHKSKIQQDYYIDIKHQKTIGPSVEFIIHYNSKSEKINTLIFNDNNRIIKDKEKIFYSMNLDEHKEQIEKKIQEILVTHNEINASRTIKYLGYLDDFSFYYSNINSNCRDDGMIYFFYEDDTNKTKIIRYNNYKNKWIIGDYK
jgi:hypothetical protein